MVLSVFQTTWAQELKNTQSGQLSGTSISEQDVASNGYDEEATRNRNKIAGFILIMLILLVAGGYLQIQKKKKQILKLINNFTKIPNFSLPFLPSEKRIYISTRNPVWHAKRIKFFKILPNSPIWHWIFRENKF